MARPHEDFVGLDGLRGVGALCVLLVHVAYDEQVQDFFKHASFGVDMFFVLSGFVIANAYQDALQGGLPVRDYCRTRFLRLYPTIIVGALISVLVAIGWSDTEAHELAFLFVMQALVLPVIGFGPTAFPLNGAYWSLFFECLANVTHAKLARVLSLRHLGYIALLGAVALIVCAFHWGHLNLGYSPETFLGGLARVTYSFSMGILLLNWRKAGALRLPRVNIFIPIAMLAVMMWAPAPDWRFGGVVHDLFLTLILAPLIVALAINAHTPARSAPLLTWLGLISYPLYAVHMPILDIFADTLTAEGLPKWAKAIGWAIAMGTCVFVAWLVAVFFEPVARRWLGRLLPRPSARAQKRWSSAHS